MSCNPSIFNNIIGPIMRGPSSSHVAGAVRIGLLSKQLIQGKLKKVIVEFDINGSLATTYDGHGTDIGLAGGLLGYKPDDERISKSLKIAEKQGLDIVFKTSDYGASHPNTYKLKLFDNQDNEVDILAISVGGGMVEIVRYNNFKISINGEYFETIIFLEEIEKNDISKYFKKIKQYINEYEFIEESRVKNDLIINIKTRQEIPEKVLNNILKLNKVDDIKFTKAILPGITKMSGEKIFSDADEILEISKNENLEMWELAIKYENYISYTSEEEVINRMKKIIKIMKNSICEGIKGTKYDDRILGPQANLVKRAWENGELIPDNIKSIIFTMAMMEVKSAMGVIVAAPTAGSCGVIPGSIIGTANSQNMDDEKILKALLSVSLIGILIAKNATFAGEEGGCQAECGAASGMAAAGLVQLKEGTVQQGFAAASIALQNTLGLICDPVANRVEVPCLGRNIMATTNAIAAANLALAGVDEVIPLNEVIDSMYKVGQLLPSELCCTGKGGLSITGTSKEIENSLSKR